MGKILNYRMFESPYPKWPFSFLCPEGWEVREITIDDSIEIFVTGPRNRANTFSVSLTVGGVQASGQSLRAFLDDYLARYRSLSTFREIARTSGLLAGSEAIEVEIAYTMLLPLNSINAQATVIRERRIFLKRDEKIYELVYAATEEDYETWLPAFQTLARTFAFREEPAERRFYALVTPVQAMRENGEGYEAEGGEP